VSLIIIFRPDDDMSLDIIVKR